jgi:hypothetical protein
MLCETIVGGSPCAAAVCAVGAARADTMTFAIDAGFSTCMIFDFADLAAGGA